MGADVDLTIDDGHTLNVGLTGGLNVGLTGGLDVGLDDINVDLSIPVIHLDPISVAVTNIPLIETESNVALDLKLAITELPKIRLEFGFKPMRVHFPTHYQFCFSMLGVEVFKFALCGESMVVCEDYLPHETEKCG